jgi:signal transduction histidine kinase
VTLTANQSGSDLHLVVRDNGCGIPPKDRERLFEAFYTTKGSRGTGLGLACSAKVAQEHGGSILVESESGKGSAFTVALPWKREGGERLEGSTTEPLA